jgi:(+)-neomenthol dehydrogenase
MATKIASVTDGNRGIGLEICRQLAARGITVLMESRELAQGKTAVTPLHQQSISNIYPYQLTVNSKRGNFYGASNSTSH